jgi:hypothetical protein
LSLPSYQTLPERGRVLLEAILQKATISVNADLRQRQPSSLKDARFYLDLAAFLVTERRVASAADLLRFYYQDSNLTSKMVLERLPVDDQIFVIVNIAEALASLDDKKERQFDSTPEQIETLRYQAVVTSPVLLEARPRISTSWLVLTTILYDARHLRNPRWFNQDHGKHVKFYYECVYR